MQIAEAILVAISDQYPPLVLPLPELAPSRAVMSSLLIALPRTPTSVLTETMSKP